MTDEETELREALAAIHKLTRDALLRTKRTYHDGPYDGINHWMLADEIATIAEEALERKAKT